MFDFFLGGDDEEAVDPMSYDAYNDYSNSQEPESYETQLNDYADIDGSGGIGDGLGYDSDYSNYYGSGSDSGSTTVVGSKNETKQEGGGAWYTDKRVLGPILETVVGLGGMMFQNGARKDALEAQKEQSKQDQLYALALERLKAKYAKPSGGGSRGGGGGGSNQRGAQLLSAYQQFIQGRASINQRNQESIRSMGNNIAGSYLAGRR